MAECTECATLAREAVACMEANVDRKYLTSGNYVTAEADGRSRCSVHGSDYYRRLGASPREQTQ